MVIKMDTIKKLNSICMNCGKEGISEFWELCDCASSNYVHRAVCHDCDKIIGYLINDDLCSFDRLYCHDCVIKAVNKRKERK